MTDDEFVPIHTLSDRFEADLLMGALQQEGIPAMLRSFEETAYAGIFTPQKGWGKIFASREYADRAREVIGAIVAQEKRGRLYESPEEIDPLLWESLRNAVPEEICQRALVQYDPESSSYIVPFLGSAFLVSIETRSVEPVDADNAPVFHKLTFQFHLAMLHYLLEAQDAPLANRWVSEKELPGGSFFFRGPHEMPVKPLLKRMDANPGAFRSAAEKLGGKLAEGGDIAYRFTVLPRIPLLFQFWDGDEEFEAALHIRFDASITTHMPALDVILSLVNVVAYCLARVMKDNPA